MANLKKKPTSLVRREKIEPDNYISDKDMEKIHKDKVAELNKIKKDIKKKKKNTYVNVRLPQQTKDSLDVFSSLTGDRFTYEAIQSAIDYFISNKFTGDQKRVYKTMLDLKSKR